MYVEALESNYMKQIGDNRRKLDKMRRTAIKNEGMKINEAADKSELEQVFIDSIEEVRKEIMKRRLKNEILNKKQFKNNVKFHQEEAKEFEETLVKLSYATKNKIKFSDFTPRDKTNLIDLFVNNEKILLKIYEALFPSSSSSAMLTEAQTASNAAEVKESIFDEPAASTTLPNLGNPYESRNS